MYPKHSLRMNFFDVARLCSTDYHFYYCYCYCYYYYYCYCYC